MTSTSPRVSVVTIFLNAERFIHEAIESVLAQTYDSWELLLVDDGSHDRSTAVARDYASRHPGRLRYIEHSEHRNLGMSASRNAGITHARGEFVLFLDSDDVLLPGALAEQVEILDQQPAAAMVYGSSLYWWSWTGRVADARRDVESTLGVTPHTLFAPPSMLLHCDPLGSASAPCLGSLMVRRDALDRVGRFEDGFPSMYEDQAFLVKIHLAEPVFVSDRCWSRYRKHEGSCCAVAIRTGQDHRLRRYFLEWFEAYLRRGRITDRRVWRALRAALERYHHPFRYGLRHPAAVVRVARRSAGAFRGTCRGETRT